MTIAASADSATCFTALLAGIGGVFIAIEAAPVRIVGVTAVAAAKGRSGAPGVSTNAAEL